MPGFLSWLLACMLAPFSGWSPAQFCDLAPLSSSLQGVDPVHSILSSVQKMEPSGFEEFSMVILFCKVTLFWILIFFLNSRLVDTEKCVA